MIGEIEADFLDIDELNDIATSSRQKLREDDDRYKELKSLIFKTLKIIQKERAVLKESKGEKEALEIDPIRHWYESLGNDSQKRAKKLFSKINQIETNIQHRKTLYKHAVFAFENMRFKDIMNSFDRITDENFDVFLSIFNDYKDIESTYYHEITSGRIKIIDKLKEHINNNELERLIQAHIFENLWLLDPSWERATEPVSFEERITAIFEDIKNKEKEENINGRIDLKYRKTTQFLR